MELLRLTAYPHCAATSSPALAPFFLPLHRLHSLSPLPLHRRHASFALPLFAACPWTYRLHPCDAAL